MTFRINLKHVQSQINFEYLFIFLLFFFFFIEDTKYGSGFIIWDNWVSFNPSCGSPLFWKPPRERILLPLDQPRLQLCLRNLWRANSKMITSCKMQTGQRGESGDWVVTPTCSLSREWSQPSSLRVVKNPSRSTFLGWVLWLSRRLRRLWNCVWVKAEVGPSIISCQAGDR